MPGTDTPVPPMAYPVVWLILGLVAVAIVVAWYVIVALLTRKPHVPIPGEITQFDHRHPYGGVRGRYLEQVDEIERDLHHEVIDAREAHQQLAAVLRDYATKTRSLNVNSMTLSDLKNHPKADQYAPLIGAIETYYPPEFAVDQAPATDDAAFERARDVLRTW